MHEVREETLLDCKRFRVHRVTEELDNGRLHARDIVRHPGSVVLLPLLDDGRICFVRNYRTTVAQTLVELPAGTLEPGEDPLHAARRELIEETGYRAETIEQLLSFYVSPGILDEHMHAYLARDLKPDTMNLDEGERIEPLLVSWDEALAMIDRHQIHDVKTLAVLLYYERRRYARA